MYPKITESWVPWIVDVSTSQPCNYCTVGCVYEHHCAFPPYTWRMTAGGRAQNLWTGYLKPQLRFQQPGNNETSRGTRGWAGWWDGTWQRIVLASCQPYPMQPITN